MATVATGRASASPRTAWTTSSTTSSPAVEPEQPSQHGQARGGDDRAEHGSPPRVGEACVRPPPPARSPRPARTASPRRRARPISCSPSGRPSASRPAGTLMPGRPARFTVTVKTSFRYMATGSAPPFSPMPKAADGAAGVRRASTPLSKASSKSSAMRRADLLRLEVIGVVVAGREHIGADQDAALHLLAEARGAGLLVDLGDVARPARAGRSACRRSGRGWTRPRPGPRCSRPAGRTWCAAGETSTISQPASFSQAMPCSQSASISAGMPSTRYSLGTPMRRPLTELADEGLEVRHRHVDRLVESFGSCPAMERSRIAASSTVCAIGPAWSSDEAKATMPQREQRP